MRNAALGGTVGQHREGAVVVKCSGCDEIVGNGDAGDQEHLNMAVESLAKIESNGCTACGSKAGYVELWL